jgi:hypothetical protein
MGRPALVVVTGTLYAGQPQIYKRVEANIDFVLGESLYSSYALERLADLASHLLQRRSFACSKPPPHAPLTRCYQQARSVAQSRPRSTTSRSFSA